LEFPLCPLLVLALCRAAPQFTLSSLNAMASAQQQPPAAKKTWDYLVRKAFLRTEVVTELTSQLITSFGVIPDNLRTLDKVSRVLLNPAMQRVFSSAMYRAKMTPSRSRRCSANRAARRTYKLFKAIFESCPPTSNVHLLEGASGSWVVYAAAAAAASSVAQAEAGPVMSPARTRAGKRKNAQCVNS